MASNNTFGRYVAASKENKLKDRQGRTVDPSGLTTSSPCTWSSSRICTRSSGTRPSSARRQRSRFSLEKARALIWHRGHPQDVLGHQEPRCNLLHRFKVREVRLSGSRTSFTSTQKPGSAQTRLCILAPCSMVTTSRPTYACPPRVESELLLLDSAAATAPAHVTRRLHALRLRPATWCWSFRYAFRHGRVPGVGTTHRRGAPSAASGSGDHQTGTAHRWRRTVITCSSATTPHARTAASSGTVPVAALLWRRNAMSRIEE